MCVVSFGCLHRYPGNMVDVSDKSVAKERREVHE